MQHWQYIVTIPYIVQKPSKIMIFHKITQHHFKKYSGTAVSVDSVICGLPRAEKIKQKHQNPVRERDRPHS